MDLIITNGNIITMDDTKPKVEALAVKNGIIEAVGSASEIDKLRKKTSKIIDIEGKLVLPGFNDSHMHLLNYGVSLSLVDLQNCKSIDEVIVTVKNFIETNNIPKGTWVKGMRFNHHLFSEKRLPNRADLDKISLDHPIVLSRVCGHVIIASSFALEIIGINKHTSQIAGGEHDIDHEGNPIGIFREKAIYLILNHIPKPSIDEIKNYIRTAANKLLTYGVTSVQSDDFPVFPVDAELIIKAFQQLKQEKELPLRVYEQCNYRDLASFKKLIEKGYYTGYGDDFFKIGPLKLLSDGSLGARTAYLSKPYSDDLTTKGIPVFSQEELDEFLSLAEHSKFQTAIHAIGDAAMEMTIGSIKKIYKQGNPQRHSIIHCQITNKKILEQFKELDLLAIVQPLFVSTDLHFAEERLGWERIKTSYAWKDMLNLSIPVAFSSDCPVEHPNVLHGIYAAVTRKDLDGFPTNGWFSEQKLSVNEAIYAYTMGSAFASFEEKVKGSITKGKYADMVVLSDDILTIPPDKIKDTEVLMTIVNGEIAYKKG